MSAQPNDVQRGASPEPRWPPCSRRSSTATGSSSASAVPTVRRPRPRGFWPAPAVVRVPWGGEDRRHRRTLERRELAQGCGSAAASMSGPRRSACSAAGTRCSTCRRRRPSQWGRRAGGARPSPRRRGPLRCRSRSMPAESSGRSVETGGPAARSRPPRSAPGGSSTGPRAIWGTPSPKLIACTSGWISTDASSPSRCAPINRPVVGSAISLQMPVPCACIAHP